MESVYVERAELLGSKGEFELAQRLYAKRIEEAPEDHRALFGLAYCLQEQGEGEKALRVLEQVGIRSGAESTEVLVWKAELLFRIQHIREATSLLELALKRADKLLLGRIYKLKGDIAVHEKDFDAAFECYAKAFSAGFSPGLIQVNLGVLCVREGDYENGLDYFREALATDINNDKAWAGVALIHQQKSDWALAKAACERAIEANNKNRTAVQLLCQICEQLNDRARALECLADYLSNVETDEQLSVLFIHLAIQHATPISLLAAQIELERCLCHDPRNALLLKVESELKEWIR